MNIALRTEPQPVRLATAAVKISSHIRQRIAKSGLDSPAINITRDGWELILDLLDKHARVSDIMPGHKLRTLSGAIINRWPSRPEWQTVAEVVADWADCQPNEVKEIETPGGTFITAQGVPVAYMDHQPAIALEAAE